MPKKINLLLCINDLVYMLKEYGCPNKAIIHTLKYYGFSDKDIYGSTLEMEKENE
jgi:hypothetical protein